jgi:hypothetical protein
MYTVTASFNGVTTGGSDNSSTASSVNVILQPTPNNVNSYFCSNPGTVVAGSPNGGLGGSGQQDERSYSIPANSNSFTFGVAENNNPLVPGTIGITAFADVTGAQIAPSNGQQTATATQNILTSPSQNDVVTNIVSTPATAYHVASTNNHNNLANFGILTTNGTSSVVSGATVHYVVTSSQGNTAGTGTCGGTTNPVGTLTCAVPVPQTLANPAQSSPYTVTFTVPQTANNGVTAAVPTTSSQLLTATPATSGSETTLSCGGTSTKRNNPNSCFEPTTATTETFTATVTDGSAAENPEANVLVRFDGDNGSLNYDNSHGPNSGRLNAETGSIPPCITDDSGSCTSTFTLSGPPTDGDTFTVSGYAQGADDSNVGTEDSAQVEFTNQRVVGEPTNISVSAANANPSVGTNDVIRAQVSDAFGNTSGAGAAGNQVFFQASLGATFASTGTRQATATTGTDGQALVAVTANGAGPATVTATLAPATGNSDSCTDTGGNCTASVTVTFHGQTVTSHKEHPVITSIGSGHRGRVNIHVTSHPKVGGASVHYYRVKHGQRHLLGTKITSGGGKSSKQIRGLKPGKTYGFQVKVGSGGHAGVHAGYSKVVHKKVHK